MFDALEDLIPTESTGSSIGSIFEDVARSVWSGGNTDSTLSSFFGSNDSVLDFGGDIFNSCFDVGPSDAMRAVTGFTQQLTDVFESNGLLGSLGSLESGVMPAVQGVIAETFQGHGLLPVLTNLGGEGMMGELTSFFGGLVPGADIGSLVNMATQLLSGNGISGDKLLGLVGGIVGGMFGCPQLGMIAGKILGALAPDLAKAISGVVSGLTGAVGDVLGGATGVVGDVVGGVGKAVGGVVDAIGDIF